MRNTLIAPARAKLERARTELIEELNARYASHISTTDHDAILQEIEAAASDLIILNLLDVTITDILGEYDDLPVPPSWIISEILDYRKAIAHLAILEKQVHSAALIPA
jgi:hypothetical protein